MHELPITKSILDIALRYAEEAEAERVTDLYLVIGALSSYVDESVQFYWDIISQDTLCEGAQLHFQRLPATLKCLDCGHVYILERELENCPVCHSVRVQVVSGDDFQLESIAIETEAEEATTP